MGGGGLRDIADVFTGGAFSAISPDKSNEPASAKELERKAAREAEKKRLALAGSRATAGETMFAATPNALKTTFGA